MGRTRVDLDEMMTDVLKALRDVRDDCAPCMVTITRTGEQVWKPQEDALASLGHLSMRLDDAPWEAIEEALERLEALGLVRKVPVDFEWEAT